MGYKIVPIDELKEHERINKQRLEELKKEMLQDAKLHEPIIVDEISYVILDGHHRIKILKELNIEKVPAFLVDYYSEDVRVEPRRRIYVSKQRVLQIGLSEEKFPSKTSKHKLRKKLKKCNVSLEKLK